MDRGFTVGELRIDDNDNRAINGGNTLTFDDTDGVVNINVTNGNGNGAHNLNIHLLTNDSMIISNGSTSDFAINGNYNANNNSLSFSAGSTRFIGASGPYALTNLTTLDVYGGATAQFDNNYDVTQTGLANIGTASGNGTLNIVSSGTVYTNNSSYMRIGTSAGATGTLNLYSGAHLTMTSAANDYGIYVGHTSGATGNAFIFGAGTTALVDSYRVGENGTGVGGITQTAVVTADNQIIIGTFTGSDGDVNVTTGAALNSTGSVTVIGREGTGDLTVTNSGSTFTVSNSITLGEFSGGNGYMIISDGALLTNTSTSSDLIIGKVAGSIGSVEIQNNGTTALFYDVIVGDASAENNVLTVSNTANVDIANELIVADDTNSNGSMTVASGADVVVDGVTEIGNNGTGALTVTGTGSTFTTNNVGSAFFVGRESGSNGMLTLSSGALLNMTDVSGNLFVAHGSGSVGSVLVSGAGTTAIIGDLLMGRSENNNEFILSNSAVVTVKEELYIAQSNAYSKGAMTVQSGGDLTVASDSFIGNHGTGALTATGSNTTFNVTTGDIYVGNNSGSNGLLTLSSGSQLTSTTAGATNYLYVGNASGSIGSAVITGSGTTAIVDRVSVGNNSASDNVLVVSDNATFAPVNYIAIGETAATSNGTISVVSGADIDHSTGSFIVGQSGTGKLVVDGSGSTIDQDSGGFGFQIGYNANSYGVVTISAGGAADVDETNVGRAGTGIMTVTGSGTTHVQSNGLDFYVGRNSGANGLYTLSSGAVLTATTVGTDFLVGNASGSIGSVNIQNAGTTALLYNVIVGDASTNANVLDIGDQATVNIANELKIGDDAGSYGSVTVDGAASITGNGTTATRVGNSGTGYLTVTGSGSSVSLTGFRVGVNNGSDGHMVVSNSASVTTDSMRVGVFAGAKGTLTVQSGGDVTSNDLTYIGRNGSTGNLTITGSNTTYTGTGDIEIGRDSGGVGTMTLGTGALLINTAGSNDTFRIGSVHATSTGSVTVTGAGATAILYDVIVGDVSANENALLISDTATVSVSQNFTIADDSNSHGDVTISSGGELSTTGTTYIANAGSGTLVVTGTNSKFSGATVILGDDDDSEGIVTIASGGDVDISGVLNVGSFGTGSLALTGSNSTLDVDSHISVGQESGGHGFIDITSGAKLTNTATGARFEIGNMADSVGTVHVSGAGTTAVLYDLTVGKNSVNNNLLKVSSSAVVSVSNDLILSQYGSSKGDMTIESGGDVTVSGTSYIGDVNTGTLVITGTNSKFTGGNVIVADDAGSEGNLTVASGGSFHATNLTVKRQTSSVSVADYNIGTTTATANTITVENTFTLSDTASLTANSGNFVVGNASGDSGAVVVQSDADFTYTSDMNIGNAGTGSLTVTGSGSTFTNAANDIYVGNASGSNGLLSISSGAQITHTGTNSDLFVGQSAGSIGTVLISGAGTTALMRLSNIGQNSGNDNVAVISDSAVVDFSASFRAAYDTGSKGMVTVSSGADVTVGSNLVSGRGGTGTMTFTGSNTTVSLDNSGDVLAGRVSGGNGLFTVSSGALLTATGTNNQTVLGWVSDSVGSMAVTGAGTTALLYDVKIGDASTEANAMIVSNTANVSIVNELIIADDANSNGTITIQSGAGVSTTTTSYIGNNGTGALTIDGAGSTYTGTTVNVGNAAGSVGTLTLSNGGTIDAATVNLNQTGSSFVADTIAIGNAAAEIDTLNINAGTTATATTIDIGSGGNLNLARSDGITGSSNMTLSGGTFTTNGNDQAAGGLGTLTMTANSVIDVGAGAIINWAVLDETAWTGTLSIHNWSSGKHNAAGSDQLIFADHAGFLHGTHGVQIKFYSDAGGTLVGSSGYFIGNALVAAPEPGTWVGIISLGLFGIYYEISRRKKKNRPKTS